MLYLENERLSQEGTYYVVNCDSCIMKSNCMKKKKKAMHIKAHLFIDPVHVFSGLCLMVSTL